MTTRLMAQALPVRGRRELRKNLTRRELLAAGRRLFAEKGLYESRIEDLSRLAGIAKGTLYGYFDNKEELIEAVVTSGFSELLGNVHRAAQGATKRADLLARVAEAHLTFFADNPDLMRVFHQVRGLLKFDHGEARGLRQVLRNYLTGLSQLLAQHPASKPARMEDELQAAMLLFGSVSGITSVRATVTGSDRETGPRRQTVRAVAGLVTAFESGPSRASAGADDAHAPRTPRRAGGRAAGGTGKKR